MRIAALAFGIVAGLVASLILALGGLDAAALAADDRQLSLIRFGLFLVANFGVLGAGIVLAAPLAGAILLLLAAIAWIVAALVLRHGPDYVMLTSPGLLLVAAVLAGLAYMRRSRRRVDVYDEDEPERVPARGDRTDEEDDEPAEESGAVAVGASFFGSAGTATPMHGAMGHAPEPVPLRTHEPSDSWEPIRRRTEPPRTKPMFRPPEEEYEEEGGFSRAARLTSSVLSFGLYAGLVAAAVLVFVNLRNGEPTRPAVTVVNFESSSQAVSVAPPSSEIPVVAEAPLLSAPPATPASGVAPVLAEPSSAASDTMPAAGITVADASTPLEPPSTDLATDLAPPTATVPAPPEPPSSSSEPPPEDLTMGQHNAAGPLMPYPMPSAIAAERNRPPARRPAAPPQRRPDAGL